MIIFQTYDVSTNCSKSVKILVIYKYDNKYLLGKVECKSIYRFQKFSNIDLYYRQNLLQLQKKFTLSDFG